MNFPKQIILLTGLSLFLALLRVLVFGNSSLLYIIWNIFLAVLPFLISSFLLSRIKVDKLSSILFVGGGIIWLLLLPNAPYLVTDLIHIGVVRAVPALYDAFFLFVSAWVGMLFYFHSLSQFEKILKFKYSVKLTNILILLITLLTSFGIYLGRFLRFNSWDIFIDHFSVLKSVWTIFSRSTSHLEVYLYTALFFVFLVVSYWAWKSTYSRHFD